jgi:septal ring factor EnvC (AmiA/AmiB activator)
MLSKRSLVVGLIIGLVFGSLMGYGITMMRIVQLQQRISELERELANKNADISKLQQLLASKESRISSLEQQVSDLQNQLANKDTQISKLQSEINRLINATRIVQSEAYLMRMNGTFNQNIVVLRGSTYFTTLGRQIKIVARLWANQKIIVKFYDCNIYILSLWR